MRKDLRAEIEAHIEEKALELIESGMPEKEAWRLARREFGNATLITESSRDVWSWTRVERLWQDLRYAGRSMRKKPGFFVSAILILGLGIGVNTAVFSVIRAVLLDPLPYSDPDQLVMVWNRRPADGTQMGVSSGDFVDLQKLTRSFSGVGAINLWFADVAGSGEPFRVAGAAVSASFFQILKAQPALGRTLLPEEDYDSAAPVAVLTHKLWQERFGADPKVVGSRVNFSGITHTVVGVLRDDFAGPCCGAFEIYVPLRLSPQRRVARGGGYMNLFARLNPGTPLAAAQAEMDLLTRQFAAEQPTHYSDRRLTLLPLREQWVGNVRPLLIVLWGAVLAILLITCANLANLLLTHASARNKELAVRASLGASRARLVRQLLTESIALALCGGGLGLALAWSVIRVIPAIQFAGVPRLNEVSADPFVMAFGLSLSVLTGLLFGTFPAWRISRADPQQQLQESGRSGTAGHHAMRLRSGLIVAQISFALVLLIAAGLLIRSFLVLQSADLGYKPDGVLTFSLSLPSTKYSAEKGPAFFAEVREKLAAIPRVADVGAISFVPPSGFPFGWGYRIESHPLPPGVSQPFAQYRVVTPGFFASTGIRLVAGRDFNDRDSAGAPLAGIVNESLARLNWPGENPLGKRYARQAAWITVVGVVADARLVSAEQPAEPAIFEPLAQASQISMAMTVRTETEPMNLVPTIRAQIRAINADAVILSPMPMDARLSLTLGQRRLVMLLLASFAGLALLLATFGIYSVVSYAVAQRTPEFGVRVALGARYGDILRMVLQHGAALAGAGIALGLVGAISLSNLIVKLLYGITPTDALTIASVSSILFAIALLGCYLPARRVLRIDPASVLRHE
jgi:putative ABC transport system permease protein